MAYPIFSTIARRRAERPSLVTYIGSACCSTPLILGGVLLIDMTLSSPDTVRAWGGTGALLGYLGLLGLFSVLGYGFLILNRISYWSMVLLMLGGAIHSFIAGIQTNTFSLAPFVCLLLVGYLLQRSVGTAFRY